MVYSMVDVASSADLLSRPTTDDDRAKPVSSNVAHARTSAIDAATVTAAAKPITSVERLYVTPLDYIDRISTFPFSSSVNQSEDAQQFIRTTKFCLLGMLMPRDERNSEGLSSPT